MKTEEQVRKEIKKSAEKVLYKNKPVINSTNVYKVSSSKNIDVVVGFNSSINEKELAKIKENFRAKVLDILQKNDKTVVETSYTNI